MKLKHLVISILFTSLLCTAMQADAKSKYGPITIINQSGHDIRYVVSGSYGGAIYAIPNGSHDIYHAGKGDDQATFSIGICPSGVKPDLFGWSCKDELLNKPMPAMSQCSGTKTFVAFLVREIRITSPTTCDITCYDIDPESCRN